MKICPKCNDKHAKNGTFCSRRCANSKKQSEYTKAKISIGLKNRDKSKDKQKQKAPDKISTCNTCQVVFAQRPNSNKKYCTYLCSTKRPNQGGYREGSGRAKTGYYKGTYCGSTYELAWLIYQLDHGAKPTRFNSQLEKDGVKYIPDFILNGTIYEMKGYERDDRVAAKTAVAKSHGYEVVVLRKADLEQHFDWVKTNYEYKHMWELYDSHRPKFTYSCDYCAAEVNREYISKTTTVFCNQSCAGKYRNMKRYERRNNVDIV